MPKLFEIGAAYYPDYLSERDKTGLHWRDQVRSDLDRMRRDRIGIIRMGEFSWSTFEPKRNQLNPERFHATLDLAKEHEINVLFCTPTATPPKWLVDEIPDILPVTRDGARIPFGSRRHYDVCNQHYREEAARISEIYSREFGNHPAIVGWQVDNEFGCHSSTYSFSLQSRKRFHEWLTKRYQERIDLLNDAWFTCFWSQAYTDFSEIELPCSSWADQNPHMELDFRRFSNEMWKEFQKVQCDIIRKNSPGRFITHNFMSMFTELCPWTMSKDLDVAGFDHYQMESEPSPIRSHWQFCLMHALKRNRFIVLEQQPLQVNWQSTNRRFGYDWLFLWGVQAALLGASAMLYFSWQRMYGGCEQYHDGIVPHDIRVTQSWQERVIESKLLFFETISKVFDLKDPLVPIKDILIIHSFESQWTHQITSQSQFYDTAKELDLLTELFTQSALGVDFAETLTAAISQYKCVVLPGYAFELTDEERFLLKQFISGGGRVLSLPRTAMKEINNKMSRLPAFFLNHEDFYVVDYGAMLEGEHEVVELYANDVDDDNNAITVEVNAVRWAEKIGLNNDRWKTVATFTSGLYRGSPAAIQFSEKGCWMHLAFCAESTSQLNDWILKSLSLKSAIKTGSPEAQAIRLSSGDKQLIGIINFGIEKLHVTVENFSKAYTFSLNGESLSYDEVPDADRLKLNPRGIVILELA